MASHEVHLGVGTCKASPSVVFLQITSYCEVNTDNIRGKQRVISWIHGHCDDGFRCAIIPIHRVGKKRTEGRRIKKGRDEGGRDIGYEYGGVVTQGYGVGVVSVTGG